MNWSRGVLLPIDWYCCCHQFCSIAQSCPTRCNSWTAVTGLPCPSRTLGACSNSCPSSRWCPLLLLPSIFPSIRVFPMSQFFPSGGQSIGASASASVLPVNTQDWFPLGWTGWIFLQAKGLSRVFSNTTVYKHQFFGAQLIVQLSHPYMTTGNTIALTRWTFVGKVMSLLFSMLSRLVIAFLPRSKLLLISWLRSPSTVILEPKKRKSVTVSIVLHLFAIKWWGPFPWS